MLCTSERAFITSEIQFSNFDSLQQNELHPKRSNILVEEQKREGSNVFEPESQVTDEVNGKSCEENSSTKKSRLGTRLVNLDILRAGLMCKICAQILSLDDIVEIRKFGGADHFKIQCSNCFSLNDAYTSDHRNDENGRKVFNINCRIALGL